MKPKFFLRTDKNEKRTMYSKNDNNNVMIDALTCLVVGWGRLFCNSVNYCHLRSLNYDLSILQYLWKN